jgi:transketolase
LEEHVIAGGLGGAIAEACLEAGVKFKSFRRLGIRDEYPEFVGDQAYLRAHHGLAGTDVANAARRALDG